jgi:hypothetical protein
MGGLSPRDSILYRRVLQAYSFRYYVRGYGEHLGIPLQYLGVTLDDLGLSLEYLYRNTPGGIAMHQIPIEHRICQDGNGQYGFQR